MRSPLGGDVLVVLEEDDLRRAPDARHYQLAQQLRRTLITLDRDYLDDRRFPPADGSGVLVIHAPDARLLAALLERIDRALSRQPDEGCDGRQPGLPLAGRKMQAHTDWGRPDHETSTI